MFLMTVGVTLAQHGFGVRGGLNLAKVSEGSAENLVSFCAGFYYQYQENKPLTLRVELGYSVHGSESPSSTLKLDYAVLATMARFHKGIVSLHVGPQLGILVLATRNDVDITNVFNRMDIIFNLGAGIEIPGGTEFGFRYGLGLTGIEPGGSFSNRVMQFTVSFPFHGHGHARRETP